VESAPSLAADYVGFNAWKSPFTDSLVRKAFSHAVDRARYVREAHLSGEPATRGGFVPPSMPAHSHRAGLQHDPDLARRLLEEAGYPGGRGLPELTLAARVPEHSVKLATQWLEELGVRTLVHQLDQTARAEDVHMSHDAWEADYPDPGNFLQEMVVGATAGIPLYRDNRIEALLAEARALPDRKARIRLYNDVEQRWITERAGILPLHYMRREALRRPWVEGFWVNLLSSAPFDELTIRR
jgi:ABC-type transport system substrate-binding protein